MLYNFNSEEPSTICMGLGNQTSDIKKIAESCMNPHACWLVAARQSGRNFGENPNLPAHFGDNLNLRYLLLFCLKSTAVQTTSVP